MSQYKVDESTVAKIMLKNLIVRLVYYVVTISLIIFQLGDSLSLIGGIYAFIAIILVSVFWMIYLRKRDVILFKSEYKIAESKLSQFRHDGSIVVVDLIKKFKVDTGNQGTVIHQENRKIVLSDKVFGYEILLDEIMGYYHTRPK